MESHFAENELVGKKARFMALTYGRLLVMFKDQFMPEPAIYCGKQYLVYNQIAPTSLNAKANILYKIGLEYHILGEMDSVVFYYDTAFNALHDSNTIVYRDLMASQAVFDYFEVHDTIKALNSLKSIATQAESEAERIARYSTIGDIYENAGQLDSAKVYQELVFKFAEDAIDQKLAAKALYDIALSEGDTLKANQYAPFLIEDVAAAAENQKQVSKLNDLFQNYLQEKQEAASLRQRKKAVRLTLMVLVPLLVAIGLTLGGAGSRGTTAVERGLATARRNGACASDEGGTGCTAHSRNVAAACRGNLPIKQQGQATTHPRSRGRHLSAGRGKAEVGAS